MARVATGPGFFRVRIHCPTPTRSSTNTAIAIKDRDGTQRLGVRIDWPPPTPPGRRVVWHGMTSLLPHLPSIEGIRCPALGSWWTASRAPWPHQVSPRLKREGVSAFFLTAAKEGYRQLLVLVLSKRPSPRITLREGYYSVVSISIQLPIVIHEYFLWKVLSVPPYSPFLQFWNSYLSLLPSNFPK